MISYIKNGKRTIVGGSTDDAVMLKGLVEITEATDLNTLTSIANYYKQSTSFAVTNAPSEASGVTSTFRLRVEKGLGPDSTSLRQTLSLVSGKDYIRVYDSAWSDWTEVGSGGGGGSADFPTGGSKGEALIKHSSLNNDVEWGDPKSAGVEMTLAEYNALSSDEKNDGTIRFVKDAPGLDVDATEFPIVDFAGLITDAGAITNLQALINNIADRTSMLSVANGAVCITYNE